MMPIGLLPLLVLVAWPASARGADALWYEFNEPFARATGPAARIFDWSTQQCISGDIPDQAARAWRDAAGQVTLVASHAVTRRRFGSTLENGVHQCTPVMSSSSDGNPAHWDYAEWLSAPYTPDGRNVYSLVHEEYRGWLFEPDGYCIQRGETWTGQQKCWYNAITLARSTDGGASFTNSTPPTHYVASVPYRYTRGSGPIGIFNPSNIVRGRDGYLYSIVRMSQSPVQAVGACLLRTRDISDPTSWRAWNGSGFTVRFLDPYVNNITNPSQHACAPLPAINTTTDSLTWSTYFKRWLLLGPGGSDNTNSGFHAYTSDDLINWRWEDLMVRAELPWTHICNPPEPDFVLYPSVLDPDSKSRNFETTGQRPYLFFTHFNVKYNTDGTCGMNLDRDLMRVPMEFSNQQPGGPAASLSASSTSVRADEPVTFDASESRDADGSITKYEWDLDGDGTYERSGTDAVTRTSYPRPDDVTVTVRVSDDDGKATDDTTIVHVAGGAPPDAAGAPAAAAGVRSGPAALARFRLLGRLRGRDGRVVVRAHVPAAGRLAVRGRGLRKAAAHAARAGVIRLRVRLARRVRGRVRAVITFTPVGGAAQRTVRAVKLRR